MRIQSKIGWIDKKAIAAKRRSKGMLTCSEALTSININGNKMNNECSTTRGKGRDTSTSALQLIKKCKEKEWKKYYMKR